MSNPNGPNQPGAEAIEADIARTRKRLAETVDQLHHSFDVKAQAQARARQTVKRARVTFLDPEGRPRPGPVTGVVAGAAVLVLVVAWRRGARARRA